MTTTAAKNPIADRHLEAAAQLHDLGELRAGLEHELRSPLNAVVLNLALLRELVRGGGGEQAVAQLERLDVIEQSVRRLEAGLQGLLAETELPSGEVEVFDLDPMLASVAGVVRAELRQRGGMLELEPPPRCRIRGRRTALRQALLRLLVLVVRQTSPGGLVTLRASSQAGECVIDVASEADPSDTRGSRVGDSGRDLSLRAARRLAERAAGGTITESDNGIGWRLTLPEATT